jgi:AcrR family transcriptional regulator
MSTKVRREQEKERRRSDILLAAENLFFSKGYENVSLNEIANEVQLGRSTIYLYFDNKEELFFAIVLKGAILLYKMVQKEVKNSNTALDKLAAFRSAYYAFAKEYPDHLISYNYLMSGRFDIGNIEQTEYRTGTIAENKYYSTYNKSLEEDLNTDVPIPKFTAGEYLNELMRLRGELLDILCKSIEQGKEEGTIRPNVNAAEATVLLTLIANSIDNLPPDLEMLLEDNEIEHEEFLRDVGEFIGYMVSNKFNNNLK